MNRPREALEFSEKAIEKDSQNANNYARKGSVYL